MEEDLSGRPLLTVLNGSPIVAGLKRVQSLERMPTSATKSKVFLSIETQHDCLTNMSFSPNRATQWQAPLPLVDFGRRDSMHRTCANPSLSANSTVRLARTLGNPCCWRQEGQTTPAKDERRHSNFLGPASVECTTLPKTLEERACQTERCSVSNQGSARCLTLPAVSGIPCNHGGLGPLQLLRKACRRLN